MKISIKGHKLQFTLVTIVAEEVPRKINPIQGVIQGLLNGGTEIKAVVYCMDKERKAHKFLAEDIERYD